MNAQWETRFQGWCKPSSDSEEAKREYTERAIREAIKESPILRDRSLRVFAKGSYKNNTNVRLNSDVDVAVEILELFQYAQTDDATGLSPAQLGISPYQGSYSAQRLKDELVQVLSDKFGWETVTRRNKAIQVREGSRSLDADVVPCVKFRRYVGLNPYIGARYHEGIQIHADSGEVIENWPEQTYTNGVSKNEATGRNYKRIVRILKRLESKMVEEGIISEIPSFLIESLVYNVPNSNLINSTYWEDVKQSLSYMVRGTSSGGSSPNWVEVNELKWLFRPNQKWNEAEANRFALEALQYVGF